MRMLRLYQPPAEAESCEVIAVPEDTRESSPPAIAAVDEDTPVILSFMEWAPRLRSRAGSALRRAHTLLQNSRCPECRSPAVLPLHLNDGRTDQDGRLIPGSSSVVGFHCDRCQHEWPGGRSL